MDGQPLPAIGRVVHPTSGFGFGLSDLAADDHDVLEIRQAAFGHAGRPESLRGGSPEACVRDQHAGSAVRQYVGMLRGR
jgi:hypothetical protein